ncbi:hypothetical protein [Terrabacter terrigena]|uniref:Uncharacterized protein n=1 Tax=Terrabacter terrigena TaxID=574718 RepID=A0ABW3N1C2_9MICO
MSRTDHHNNRKPEWDRLDRVVRRLRRRISARRRDRRQSRAEVER